MKTKLLIIVITICTILSCKATNLDSEIIGTWEGIESPMVDLGIIDIWVFNEDGTFTWSIIDTFGVYTIEEKKLQIEADNGEKVTYDVLLEGDILTLSYPDSNGELIVMKYKKTQ